MKAAWLPHYNDNDYKGEWKALPLRTINGSTGSHFAGGEVADYKDTELMEECPGIKEIVDGFRCNKLSVRLLNLRPGSLIKEHRDRGLFFEDGLVRIHVPIQTSDQVEFFLDNEEMKLQSGSCWYMNFDLPHRLANKGETDRVHLVFDCEVNDWVKDLFASCSEEQVKRIEVKDKFSIKDKQQIIAALRRMDTETSREMADRMEHELAIQE